MKYIHRPTGAVVTSDADLPDSEWERVADKQEQPEPVEKKPSRAPRARKAAQPKE